jgi:hypothetical protein
VQTKASGYLAYVAAGPCVGALFNITVHHSWEKYTTVIVNTIYSFILSIFVQQNLTDDCE